MKTATFCKGCWAQLRMVVPLRGPLSLPFRLMGIKPTRMNPNLCNMCETRFSKVMKAKQITRPVTILFADVRGYTGLSRLVGSEEVRDLLTGFYDRCASVVWEKDGIVNKLMGDAILVVFNFPIAHNDHVERAVYAGWELQKKCQEMKSLRLSSTGVDFGVGVGIHTGTVCIGEIGEFIKDFTVIGEVVNLGSRLQAVARPGEVILSEAVYERVKDAFPGISARTFNLKGIDQPVKAYVLAHHQ